MTLRQLYCVSLLLHVTTSTASPHMHRRPSHRHHPRQPLVAVVPTGATDAVRVEEASSTAADTLVSDIDDIQTGLSDLPQDLIDFMEATKQQISELQESLENLVEGQSAPTTVPPPATASVGVPPAETSFSTMALEAPASGLPMTASSSTTYIVHTKRTSRITSTHTHTLTWQTSSAAAPTVQQPLYPATNSTASVLASAAVASVPETPPPVEKSLDPVLETVRSDLSAAPTTTSVDGSAGAAAIDLGNTTLLL